MTKRKVEPLVGKHCALRLIEPRDLETLRRWRNQDSIRSWFVHSDVISPEQQAEWWNAYKDRDDDFVFIIEEIGEQRAPVGAVSIYHVDPGGRRAEYGRLMIGEAQARGKGLGRDATRLAFRFAFDVLELKEVYLEVFEDNAPAIRIYEQCGFELTGKKDRMVLMRICSPKADPE